MVGVGALRSRLRTCPGTGAPRLRPRHANAPLGHVTHQRGHMTNAAAPQCVRPHRCISVCECPFMVCGSRRGGVAVGRFYGAT